MRIHRISLRDFRGVTAADVELAVDGITIIQGPNEVGKSSLADAVDMLLEDPDSSGRARVKAAQPMGSDVGPWVEMDFETGPYRMTYSKRWVRGPSTELTITAPAPEQLTGRAAHDRVEAILGETLDTVLFGALRHQQGVPLGQAELGGSSTLATALDAAAAGPAAGGAEPDGGLMEAIEQARLEWSTPGGSPNRARLDLREAADAARGALEREEASLRALEDRIEEHHRVQSGIATSEAREPAMREAVAALEAANAAVMAREAALRDLGLSAEIAESAAREAELAAASREALVVAVSEDEARIAEITAESERSEERAGKASRARSVAAARLSAATEARVAADAAHATAVADAQHLRDVFDLEFLGERRDRVGVAEEAIAAAEDFLAGCALDAALMARIERAAEDAAVARGRLGAAGTRVRLVAESPQRVETRDQTWDLAPGGEMHADLGPGGELVLPGIARIGIEDEGGAVADAERVNAILGDLLREAGISAREGVAGARLLDRRRREEESRAASAREARAQALRDLTPDDMADKITRARERVAAYGSARPGDAPVPATPEEANAARARAEDARDEARREEDAARDALAAADREVARLEEEAAERSGRLRAVTARRDADRDALEAARAERADVPVMSAARSLRAEATAARARHRAEADSLAAEETGAVRDRLGNAREALDRLVRERNDLRLRAERLAGEISSEGDEGLADRVARARERAEAADYARDLAERRGDAADLLHEVMTHHRDLAQRSYVAPFRAEVERLAGFVFGPGTSVEVDHASLTVTSRTRDGVTVGYDALSGGAREQLAVIGRLAAAALVSPGTGNGAGGAPVIIDDALGYSDVGRLEGLGAALAAAGRRSQVIVLTCAPERYAAIGNATVVRMEPSAVRGPDEEAAG